MHGSNLALAQNPAAVPAVASSDLNRQYDAAFQAMLAQPANLDVLFKCCSSSPPWRVRPATLRARCQRSSACC